MEFDEVRKLSDFAVDVNAGSRVRHSYTFVYLPNACVALELLRNVGDDNRSSVERFEIFW